MINRFCFFDKNGANRKRDSLNAWFSRQNLNDGEITNLLEQTLAQRRNAQLVKRCMSRAGYKLKSFQTNDELELYFDIYKKNKSVCYISKGWADPGFRIGEFIELDKSDHGFFKEKLYKIFKICSRNLISIGLIEQGKSKIAISFEIGIYRDGFNERVLKKAVKTLENAVGDTRRL